MTTKTELKLVVFAENGATFNSIEEVAQAWIDGRSFGVGRLVRGLTANDPKTLKRLKRKGIRTLVLRAPEVGADHEVSL